MVQRNPVYLIDDDESIRDAILLNLHVDGLIAMGFPDCNAFLSSLPNLKPGCILLDLHMPTKGGLELQTELTKACIYWPIIVVTGTRDLESCRAAFRAGAVDFLCKPIGGDELREALKRERDEQPTAFGVDGIAIVLSFRTSVLPASA
jgi:FixJ family two-component response regulator